MTIALYHFHVTQIKRSAGQSAVAAAAYRSGEKLHSEYYGEDSDYTRKGGVICSEILLPSHAPPEYANRETLWNAVEKVERGKKAQLAYSFDIALQNEFSMEENIDLARQFLMEQFVSRGMVVDFAVHQSDKEDGGIQNPHFHVMCPIRPIVEGTHEAIISKEDFELAQKVIRGGGRNPTRKQHDYPLKGLVRCGNCKRAMTRRKNKAGIRYFQCIHSVNNGNTDCPIGRSFPEMDIEKVVFHAIAQFLALAQKEAVQNREVGDLRKSAIKECADKIRTLQKQNEQNKASKLRLYEKYAAGSITKEAYIQQKAAADVKIAENDEAIQRSHERMKELDSETSCSDEKLDAVCDQYADCKALTHELTHAFISAVYIYDLDNIEIVWKFKDFLTTSEGEAK